MIYIRSCGLKNETHTKVVCVLRDIYLLLSIYNFEIIIIEKRYIYVHIFFYYYTYNTVVSFRSDGNKLPGTSMVQYDVVWHVMVWHDIKW